MPHVKNKSSYFSKIFILIVMPFSHIYMHCNWILCRVPFDRLTYVTESHLASVMDAGDCNSFPIGAGVTESLSEGMVCVCVCGPDLILEGL